MKRFVASIAVVCLFCSAAIPITYADMISPFPNVPERPKNVQEERETAHYPTYAITAGVVAVALTASLFALRAIRKRNDH
jgi:hypothetical protein